LPSEIDCLKAAIEDKLCKHVRCRSHPLAAFAPEASHGKFFVLDRVHDTTCATYDSGNNFNRCTCYGCHEPTPSDVRAEHEDEGIRDVGNCVKCRRSADKASAERGSGGDRKRVRD